MDEETGKLTRHEINDYRKFMDYEDGFIIYYRAKLGAKTVLNHRVKDRDFDRVSHSRVITYNSSYGYAYKLFIENCKQKIENAHKTIDEMSVLSDKLQQNLP